jgi:hypothetical protein
MTTSAAASDVDILLDRFRAMLVIRLTEEELADAAAHASGALSTWRAFRCFGPAYGGTALAGFKPACGD